MMARSLNLDALNVATVPSAALTFRLKFSIYFVDVLWIQRFPAILTFDCSAHEAFKTAIFIANNIPYLLC